MGKKVNLILLGREFSSVKEASECFGVSYGSLLNILRDKGVSDAESYILRISSRSIVLLGKQFKNIKEASDYFNVSYTHLSRTVKNEGITKAELYIKSKSSIRERNFMVFGHHFYSLYDFWKSSCEGIDYATIEKYYNLSENIREFENWLKRTYFVGGQPGFLFITRYLYIHDFCFKDKSELCKKLLHLSERSPFLKGKNGKELLDTIDVLIVKALLKIEYFSSVISWGSSNIRGVVLENSYFIEKNISFIDACNLLLSLNCSPFRYVTQDLYYTDGLYYFSKQVFLLKRRTYSKKPVYKNGKLLEQSSFPSQSVSLFGVTYPSITQAGKELKISYMQSIVKKCSSQQELESVVSEILINRKEIEYKGTVYDRKGFANSLLGNYCNRKHITSINNIVKKEYLSSSFEDSISNYVTHALFSNIRKDLVQLGYSINLEYKYNGISYYSVVKDTTDEVMSEEDIVNFYNSKYKNNA